VVGHDDPRLLITLPATEYTLWCRKVATACRKRLADSNEVLDIAEAVNKGINTALNFIGLKVEQQPEPKKPDMTKPGPHGAGLLRQYLTSRHRRTRRRARRSL